MSRFVALLGVTAITACSVVRNDPYPMPSGPPHVWQTGPTSIGGKVPAVVLWLAPRPGDRIELLSADPIGVGAGADVRLLLSRAVPKPDGSWLIGEQLEPLAGAVVTNETTTTGPETQVGIVAEITAHQSIRLRYRVNDGPEQVGEGIDVRSMRRRVPQR